MSRIANALNMYFYLSVKGKATIGQLADYLEVSERMIKKYKDDLEQAERDYTVNSAKRNKDVSKLRNDAMDKEKYNAKNGGCTMMCDRR